MHGIGIGTLRGLHTGVRVMFGVMMRVIYDFQRVSLDELHFEQWLIDESVIVMLVPVFPLSSSTMADKWCQCLNRISPWETTTQRRDLDDTVDESLFEMKNNKRSPNWAIYRKIDFCVAGQSHTAYCDVAHRLEIPCHIHHTLSAVPIILNRILFSVRHKHQNVNIKRLQWHIPHHRPSSSSRDGELCKSDKGAAVINILLQP